ncbi:MAG: hypothetical protein V1792_03870 [Pseudomonadota bacterium]
MDSSGIVSKSLSYSLIPRVRSRQTDPAKRLKKLRGEFVSQILGTYGTCA